MAGNEDVDGQRAVGTRQGFNVAYLKARFFMAALYQPFFKREASQSAERNEPPAGVEQRTANQPDDKELFTINH